MATIDEMLAAAVDYCIDDALSPEAAAEKAFVDGDSDAVRTLAVVGLRDMVNKALHAFRTRDAEARNEVEWHPGVPRSGRYQFSTRPSEAAAAYYWLNKPYGTADGHTRPILAHTVEDVAHNRRVADARVGGWLSRSKLWAEIQEALKARPRAKTVGDLPQFVLAELNQIAGEAFGGAVVV